uniref:Collagen triple helix repeat protein n=1 Tax=Electrophorus electricus TaxID=8005 RepID=A0AAY5EJ12_ELEEL
MILLNLIIELLNHDLFLLEITTIMLSFYVSVVESVHPTNTNIQILFVGARGQKGIIGNPGLQGFGSPGYVGNPGPPGFLVQGPLGPPGQQGVPGSDGLLGETGNACRTCSAEHYLK